MNFLWNILHTVSVILSLHLHEQCKSCSCIPKMLYTCVLIYRGLQGGSVVKNLYAEDLGSVSSREVPLKEEVAVHSSILPCRHGQSCLAGCSPRGCKESDTTESLSTHALCLYKLNMYLKMKIFWRNFSHQLQILFSLKFLSFNEEIYDSE